MGLAATPRPPPSSSPLPLPIGSLGLESWAHIGQSPASSSVCVPFLFFVGGNEALKSRNQNKVRLLLCSPCHSK